MYKKRIWSILAAVSLGTGLLAGCGSQGKAAAVIQVQIPAANSRRKIFRYPHCSTAGDLNLWLLWIRYPRSM